MANCIFSAHCMELICDQSCPILAETTYLLDRNALKFDSFVFTPNEFDVNKILDIYDKYEQSVVTVVPKNSTTVRCADMFTYCGICKYWKGSRLHCDVYHLKFAKYLESLKLTWNNKSEPEDLTYMKIWSESAKVLVVSNFDYVNFGDFECQTLLNLIQTRQAANRMTILISPLNINSSKSNTVFVNTLRDIMRKNRITLD